MILRTFINSSWFCLILIALKETLDNLTHQVRDTSHKPDEIYGMIERLSPGTRKLELFGREHNTQNNWLTLGGYLTYFLVPGILGGSRLFTSGRGIIIWFLVLSRRAF